MNINKLNNISGIRTQIVESILLLGVLSGISYLTIFVVNTPVDVWMFADIILMSIIALGLAVAVFRKKINYTYKSATIICSAYLLGVFNFIGWGLIGLGSLWFILFILMTITLHTRRAGLIAYFVAVVTMGIIALAVRLNILDFALNYETYAVDDANWLSRAMFIVILGAMIVASVGRTFDILGQQIIEFKQISEELAQSRDKLADEVQRRKATEDSLAEAVSNLKSLDTMKDKFIDSISHELRTPLANIQLYHKLLAMNPNKSKTYLETLELETTRLNSIVEQMIHASSDEYDMELTTMLEIDIKDVVQRLLKEHQQTIRKRDIQVSLPESAETYIVFANPEHIYRALSNLVDNAVKYTPDSGAISITMSHRNHLNQAMIELFITNTGTCPTEEEQVHWFERFVRGTSSLEMGVAGAGLGLPISKQIIEKYGGMLLLHCEKNDLIFTVCLPEITTVKVG